MNRIGKCVGPRLGITSTCQSAPVTAPRGVEARRAEQRGVGRLPLLAGRRDDDDVAVLCLAVHGPRCRLGRFRIEANAE